MSDDRAFWTAASTAAAIRTGEATSTEMTELYLDRIATSTINAVVTVDRDAALAAAADADAQVRAGGVLGPLHGVPITVKDCIGTAGLRTTGGSPQLADHVPARDAEAVGRLRRAGAVVLGKTNLPEFAGDIQTANPVFGATANPWNHAYTPGGSSGGSAAAVAAGLTALDLGSDIAGSIRIPSHFCGVYGLKPTLGLVPTDGYYDHAALGILENDINVYGPLARAPEDLDLALDALLTTAAPGWRAELAPVPERKLRVATWFDDPACPVDADYVALLGDFAARLAADPAVESVVADRPPVDFAEQFQLHLDLVLSAIAYNMPEEWSATPAGSHRFWLERHQRRLQLRAIWAEWFRSFDVLLCPVVAMPNLARADDGDFASRTTVINGQERSYLSTVGWCGLIGVLGLPAVVAPIGRSAEGLPAGVQIVAGRFGDRLAIELARTVARLVQLGHPPEANR